MRGLFHCGSFRGFGVGRLLFHELAKRTIEENSEYLQWATDRRNGPVQAFVERMGAVHPDIITLAASSLLADTSPLASSMKAAWTNSNYVTRPITRNDLQAVLKVNLSPDLIRQTGDLDFQGFITFEKGTKKPVAVTPGWTYLSTFQLKEGLHLEDPAFVGGIGDHVKEAVVLSVINEAKSFMGKSKHLHYLRWHVTEDNEFMGNLLRNKAKLPCDSMNGTPEF